MPLNTPVINLSPDISYAHSAANLYYRHDTISRNSPKENIKPSAPSGGPSDHISPAGPWASYPYVSHAHVYRQMCTKTCFLGLGMVPKDGKVRTGKSSQTPEKRMIYDYLSRRMGSLGLSLHPFPIPPKMHTHTPKRHTCN